MESIDGGPPPASSREVAQRMSRARRRDTAPEVAVRRELHRRGLRYRVDAPLPGLARRRADLLFTRAKVAVFLDGCFWHGCPDHGVLPKANREWWRAKLDANAARDADTDRHLHSIGWQSMRFWEHEPVLAVAARVEERVRGAVGPHA